MANCLKLLIIAALSWLVLSLSGCGGGNGNNTRPTRLDPTVERYYPFPEARPKYKLKRPVIRGRLGVAVIDADGIRSDRRMLFKTSGSPLELRLHHLRFWADSPTKLIQAQVVTYLGKINFGKKVVRYVPGVKVDYLMRGRLVKFERFVRTDKKTDQVLFSIELNVTNEKTGDVVIQNEVYDIVEIAPRGNDADDTILKSVKAFKRAFSKAMIKFVKTNAPKSYKAATKLK